MHLAFSPEHEAFRAEVRAFLADALVGELRRKAETFAHFTHADIMAWHRVLYAKGWVAPHWPKEHGGTGWDVTRRHIFGEELALAGAPALSPFGLVMLGPLLMQFGSDAQKARFLPKILSGEEVWCQGYSEPNAGSDLASLQLRAERDGEHYVLNGQKTWTTYAQYADWIFCLVRTDASGKKQEGITFLLVDLKHTAGVDVRPFLNISGLTSFCETFFTNARVPRANVVGKEGDGWRIAKALLGHERTAVAGVSASRRVLNKARRIAASAGAGATSLLDDPGFALRLAALEVQHKALEMTALRTLADAQAGRAPGPESSVLKIVGTQVQQAAYELCMDAMGHNALGWFDSDAAAMPDDQRWIASLFNYSRASSIYAGSNEIQRNIIAKQILGLG